MSLLYLDQTVRCEWVDDPENGFNDTMVWVPAQVQDCTGRTNSK